ncbi:MAG: L-arabinose 1-dehydrogenase (NAD(P)(+)) [Candidatus Woesearchaeota archaeon]|nr:L-arabinose 1-dehydrogenase (NAD(P)(+)) [Candidatus Woesearchaeota archaeon]
MKYFITGGAGFIGSEMAKRLLKKGHKVTVYDNLLCGDTSRIDELMNNPDFAFVKGDIRNKQEVIKAIKGHDFVMHFAANPDIAKAIKHPDIDLKHSVIATFHLLDAMRLTGVKKIAFTSGSGVYGDAGDTYTAEDYGPLLPISMYGASKLGAEGLISAFCNQYDMQAWVGRFGNIIGGNQTHGVILDFVNKLKNNPEKLEILGDGKQSKPYIHVDEIIDSILFIIENSKENVNVFNVACDSFTSVNKIAEIVIQEMNLENVKLEYTGGNRGWKGDVPVVRLDIKKLNELGFKIKLSSDQAVRKTAREIVTKLS